MRRVKEILLTKSDELWSIQPDATVYDAIHLLAEKEIGALVVLEANQLVGVVSERDYARHVILKGRSSERTKVRDIMSTDLITATPSQEIRECMSIMTDRRVRHLPIIESSTVVGMISIGDLVREIIAEQEATIGDLERYISG